MRVTGYIKVFCFILTVISVAACNSEDAGSPFEKKKAKKEAMQNIPPGEIMPGGWLKNTLDSDWNGLVGHLDEMVPVLTVDDDIYGKERLTKNMNAKSVGNALDLGDWDIEYLWWNSETQSNWRDGYIRNAFLSGDIERIAKAKTYVANILSTQDTDGYMGIYAPDLRYRFTSENGELWAKASLLRGLLAYYEFTGYREVLLAVEKAVKNVMDHYPAGKSTPFKSEKPYGGLCHGLMFTDVLDKLYQLTSETVYRDYALFLYRDYCMHEVSQKDVQYENIIDSSYHLACHGVHTYEHLRALTVAAYASGNPLLEEALSKYIAKIREELTPTGGPAGDEWILGRKADATDTGYEYCSIQELFDSFMLLVQKTGNLTYADDAEKIFLNAAQGAKHPVNGSPCYLKTDNSYEMTGRKNGNSDPDSTQVRYKYSFVHQDAAVCCSPNAGRITPYYIQNMWMKDQNGLTAVLFGASLLNTRIEGKKVSIRQETAFPADHKIAFIVKTDKPVDFTLSVRKPAWAKNFTCNMPLQEKNGRLSVRKQWAGEETVILEFIPGIEKHEFKGETYFSFGPQVLALPIDGVEIPSVTYAGRFQDLKYKPVRKILYEYKNEPVSRVDGQLKFNVRLLNPETGQREEKYLIPVGETILRQVTFK